MPGGDIHRKDNKFFTGKEHHDVNRLMDSTTPLSGPRHRKDKVHSLKFIVDSYGGDPEKVAAAIRHLQLDRSGLTVRMTEPLARVISKKAKFRKRYRRKF